MIDIRTIKAISTARRDEVDAPRLVRLGVAGDHRGNIEVLLTVVVPKELPIVRAI